MSGLAPQEGLEPPTLRLTAGCSTIELLRSTNSVPGRGANLSTLRGATCQSAGVPVARRVQVSLTAGARPQASRKLASSGNRRAGRRRPSVVRANRFPTRGHGRNR